MLSIIHKKDKNIQIDYEAKVPDESDESHICNLII